MPKAPKQVNKNDPEYLEKRKKNNEAIKKSREKAKAKAEETQRKVETLKKDNKMLEDKISVLGQEMQFLKDIFLAHAGAAKDEQSTKASQAAAGWNHLFLWNIWSIDLFSVAEGIAKNGITPDDHQQSIIDELLASLEQPGPSGLSWEHLYLSVSLILTLYLANILLNETLRIGVMMTTVMTGAFNKVEQHLFIMSVHHRVICNL